MLFERIYEDDLAQASYFIACQATGEAVVVDPRRDIGVYLEFAQQKSFRIVAVTETHIHADYLSGSRELAAATGAKLYLSGEGGEDWRYGFDADLLKHGDRVSIGNIVIEAIHTPGHTPEHLSFLVTDGAAADLPAMVLSGDFVFVGDLGRPDLLDEAAGGVDTRFVGARQMFDSLKQHFLTLPDYVQVWPGHGAGSACGKALGAVASTTVGYERRFAWWADYLRGDDIEGFVAALLEGQPDAPSYFGRMKRHNRDGPALLGELLPPAELTAAEVRRRLDQGAVLIDTRPGEAVRRGTVAGSLHVAATAPSRAAWVIDPERDSRELLLVAADTRGATAFRDALLRVGVDSVKGFVPGVSGLELAPIRTISPKTLGSVPGALLIDVRSRGEFDEGHLPGAEQLHAGRLMWHLERLPRDRTIVSYCQSGARNTVVSSALRAEGFEVLELEGSYLAWQAAQAEAVS